MACLKDSGFLTGLILLCVCILKSMMNSKFIGVVSTLACAGIVCGSMVKSENPAAQPTAATQSSGNNLAPKKKVTGTAMTPQAVAPATSEGLAWAEVLEQNPNPNVVTNADMLKRISQTGMPWRVKDKATGIEMVLVPAGNFMMGMSPGDTDARENEKPAHEVTLTKPFYLARYEVTQSQWLKVMQENPSTFKVENPREAMIAMLMKQGMTKAKAESMAANASIKIDALPVEKVSWDDCQSFCAKTGLQLPTEAQWEYACRAGTTDASYGAVDDIAWYESNADGETHPVAKKAPNALGLYDMIGNLWEWTSDDFDAGYYKACAAGVVDPQSSAPQSAADAPSTHVVRGSSWGRNASACRASARSNVKSADRNRFFGFRVARDI